MKRKSSILMSVLILLGTLSQPTSQATTLKAKRPVVASNNAPLPDLILGALGDLGDPKTGKYSIRIWNVGKAPAGASYVVLKLTHYKWKGDPKPKELSYHAKVPALGIWKSAAVEIETKVDVTWDKLCIIADATNQVTESNEDNNKFCGLGTDINGDPPQP